MKTTARVGSHPIHPMLIPFPLALWTTSFIFNVLGSFTESFALHQAAYWMLVAGTIGGVLAAVPGAIDLFTSVPAGTAARRIGNRHAILNVLALLLWVASLYTRQGGGGMTYAAYVTGAVALLLITASGWLGGSLVYDHHVGVAEPPRS